MTIEYRKATLNDIAEIEALIRRSVRMLGSDDYSPTQIELSITSVFGVDRDLIEDETYFAAIAGTELAGCGGWSGRKTLYGASTYAGSRDDALLDPLVDAARIRAFFVDPKWARMGIGSAILALCEGEARSFGFTRAEMMATLPGVKLYIARGYELGERLSVPVGEGVAIDCIRMTKVL